MWRQNPPSAARPRGPAHFRLREGPRPPLPSEIRPSPAHLQPHLAPAASRATGSLRTASWTSSACCRAGTGTSLARPTSVVLRTASLSVCAVPSGGTRLHAKLLHLPKVLQCALVRFRALCSALEQRAARFAIGASRSAAGSAAAGNACWKPARACSQGWPRWRCSVWLVLGRMRCKRCLFEDQVPRKPSISLELSSTVVGYWA